MSNFKNSTLAVVGAVWLGVVGAGFTLLWQHAYAAGPPATPGTSWPDDLMRDGSRPTLVMVLHPECSCSEASVGELSRIMARTTTPVAIKIFFTPIAGDPDPRDHSLWRTASSLPGVELIVDRDAQAARRFGAYVSGQTFLFDRNGALLFSGGITSARAHAGDNDGEDAILHSLESGRVSIVSTPVFGCLLYERTVS